MSLAKLWVLAGFSAVGLACASSAPKLLTSTVYEVGGRGTARSASVYEVGGRGTARSASRSRPPVSRVEPPARDPRRTPDLFVGCADRSNCPSAVGMLVLDDDQGPEPERCTASLIAADRVLTAVHCLSSVDRHDGAPCEHTWITFPETADAPAEWAACARVERISGVVSEDALQQEHAVLRLARALGRRPLEIDARPVEPNSIVQVISVTPHPIYGITHELSARLCRTIDAAPAIEALGANAAHVGWLGDCPIKRGNSGSPVLDHDGRIRAIVHGGTASVFAVGVTSGL